MWIRRLSELTLAGSLALCAVDARADPQAADDSLAESRERFKRGMDLYQQGDPAGALAIWEPVYRDLGPQRGYRVAYDLGVAYSAVDDPVHAAARFQEFLAEVDMRRGRGEPLGAAVAKDEGDARARLARLAASLGRVQSAGGVSVVRVDSLEPLAPGAIAWVLPGQHAITFDPQTPGERTIAVAVAAGATVELVAPPEPTPAAPASLAPPPPAPGPAVVRDPTAVARSQGPFPPALMLVGGGLAAGSVAAAITLEIHAQDLHDRFAAEQAQAPGHAIAPADRASFSAARTWAYVAVGGAAGLTAVTAGLVTWYIAGSAGRPSRAVAARFDGSRLLVEGSF